MAPGRKLGLFLGITAAGAAGLFALARAAIPAAPEEQQAALIAAFRVLYGMPALLAALGVQGALAQAPVVGPLGLRFRPNAGWAVALLVPLAIGGLALALALLEPGTSLVTTVDQYAAREAELRGLPDARVPELAEEASGLGASPLFFVLAGALSLGGLLFQALLLVPAELAWRGFAHHVLGELRPGIDVYRRGVVVGLAWGLWLVPLDAVGPGFSTAPLATSTLRMASAVALGVWLSVVRERSGSVLASTLFLAAVSRLALVPQRLVLGGSRLTVGEPGLALLGALTLSLLGLIVWRRLGQPVRRLRRRTSTP
jgi:hypothetical protein